MTFEAQRWQRLKHVLEQVEGYSGAERETVLQRVCAGDEALYRDALSLLAQELRIDAFEWAETTGVALGAPVRVGAYRIIRLLGSGGMGTVYLAERADDVYRKQVAIKVIHSSDSRLVARFVSERQILAALEHPFIARLLDGGTLEDGRPYLVMEYVEGRRIDEYAAERMLTLRDILRLFLDVCSAVQFAHQKLIVHRDLKAGNVLVTATGQVRLLDFGIAKAVSANDGYAETTQAYERILTPSSASPEQLAGGPVTTATDVYSLGVLLYGLLTRRSPYAGAKDIARAIAEDEPRTASAACADDARMAKLLKGDLDNVLAKALKKDPAKRYATVNEFSSDIRRYLNGEAVHARAATLLYRAGKFIRRRRYPIAAAAALLAAIIAGAAASLVYAHRAQMERARAERDVQALRKLSESLLFELHDSIRDLPGATQARALLAQRASEYLNEIAAEAGDNPVVLEDLAAAYWRLATIESGERTPHLGGIARDHAALENNEKALAIRRRLLGAHPDNAEFQKGVLASMWAVAEGKRREGNMRAVFALHTERLRLAEQLYAQYGRQDLLQSVAASYAAFADLDRTIGDNAGALRNGQKALELREKLLQLNPASAGAERLVGLSHEGLAYALSAQGDYEKAVAEHQLAAADFEQLVNARPADADFQRLLFVAENNLCESMALAGRPEAGMQACRRAIELAQSAFHADQVNVQTEEDLGVAWSAYALALKRAGQKNAALRCELHAQTALRQAIARDPDSPEASLAYLDSCLNLISLERGSAERCRHAARAWDFVNGQAQRWPEDARFRERRESVKHAAGACAATAGR